MTKFVAEMVLKHNRIFHNLSMSLESDNSWGGIKDGVCVCACL